MQIKKRITGQNYHIVKYSLVLPTVVTKRVVSSAYLVYMLCVAILRKNEL